MQEHVVGDTAALRRGSVFLSAEPFWLGRGAIGRAFQNIARKKEEENQKEKRSVRGIIRRVLESHNISRRSAFEILSASTTTIPGWIISCSKT